MLIARPLILAVALAGATGALAQNYPGQQVQTVPRPTPDADALAGAMRRLGANPRDLSALLEAAELSLRLGDVNAAASLLKRAENVDPMNGRVKAGMARILVTQERPGEALRYFDQAIGYGLDPQSFAGDRGLAYDLVGEQERAQRDYRVALKSGGSDEVQRRYALSLGISGKRQEALAVIDDQLRRNDRSAWRVRAFVLAMTGDVPGAEKIANTMMPPGMGAALAPFFARVAGLPAADRAFAVHFGELRATPQRLADARMMPPLPPLTPEANRPVQVAAVPTTAPAGTARNDRRNAREEAKRRREAAAAERRAQRAKRDEKPQVAVAVASTATARRPANEPTAFEPPRYAGVAFAPPQAVVQPVPAPQTNAGPATANGNTSQAVASAPVREAPAAGAPATSSAVQLAAASASSPPALSRLPAVSPSVSPVSPSTTPATQQLATTPVRAGALNPAPAASTPIAAPPVGTAEAPVVPSSSAPAAMLARTTPARPAISEDTILARIMAGISIPGSELGIAPVRPPEPVAAPASRTDTLQPAASSVAAAADTERGAAQDRAEAAVRRSTASGTTVPADKKPGVALAKVTTDKNSTGTAQKAAEAKEKAAVDKKAAEADAKKQAADAKAAAAKKLADAKKKAEAKKAADEKAAAAKAAKAEPSRIWVQVAGGANKDDLRKAWTAVQGKAAALKGKSAYTTPLRATNRVVTGPFKSDAEARDFVNTLAKQGLSAFPFTSDEGQKMTRLPAK